MASINVTRQNREDEVQGQLSQKLAKRARRVVSLEEKRNIPHLLFQDKTNGFIGCFHGLNESIICTIRKTKILIKVSIISCIPVSLKRCFMPCDIRMENLEMMLNICIKYKQNNKETLSIYGICDHVR